MFSTYFFLNKKNEPKTIQTYVRSLDNCIGGGLPLGKITEIVGDPDSGKTKLLFDIIENLKNEELVVAYISTTGKSLGYINSRNINRNNTILLVSNNETVILDFIKETVKYVDIFIIDSIPNILTSNEYNNFDMTINQDLPNFLSTLNTIIYAEKCSVLAVNHFINKNGEYISRWRNMFQKYCCVRVQLNKYDATLIDLMLLSHKTKPELVGGNANELRMG